MNTRKLDLDSINLARGWHSGPDEGLCLMEAVAYVAGEPHSDQPQCVCPVLAAFGRSWNDALDDEDRQRLLKPFIPRLIGTRSTPEVRRRLAYMAADWAVRVAAPAWLRAAGLGPEAGSLEVLAPLGSAVACRGAMPTIAQARQSAVAAARAAAWDAAVDAGGFAAVVAAVIEAVNAAGAYTVVVDAWDAARSAAWVAALDAARDAGAGLDDGPAAEAVIVLIARKALRPLVEQLQASAVDLYERMIEAGQP